MVLYRIMSATKNLDLLSAAAQVGLFARMLAYGTYYTAGDTPRAPMDKASV